MIYLFINGDLKKKLGMIPKKKNDRKLLKQQIYNEFLFFCKKNKKYPILF